MKKTFAALILAGCYAMVMAAPAAPGPVEQARPYLQVTTVEGEEFRIRAFFSPSCSFSKQYFPFFLNLANSLPPETRFSFTPVVNKIDGLSYAFAFAAVQRFYPRHLNNFVEASLVGVQERGLSTRNWFGIERIGKAAGVPVPLGRLVEDNLLALRADVDRLISLQGKLKVTNTPSVTVAGTYIVTPEFTGGDAEQYSALVNAVISMATVRP